MKRRTRARLAGCAAVLAALIAALAWLDWRHPLALPVTTPGAVVTDNAGTPLRTWPGPDGVWRYPVTPRDVSPHYLQALITYEDRGFYRHFGVNPWSLLRAGVQWMQHGRIVSGGSTLTMQVARILYAPAGSDSRSIPAKLRQILRALQLEWHLSKEEILALYLNHAPMGGMIEGVEMASRSWLGKPALHLTHGEAALLAALPQAPSRLRPDRHPDAARAARDKVLRRMATRGIWNAEVTADAMLENTIVPPLRARWLAPLAAERLHRHATQAVTVSTLDAETQATVERMIEDRIHALPPHVSIAVLVMENDSLALRAYAGTAEFGSPLRFGYIDMTRAVRSPGSTLKPFLYALALDDGLIHSESLLVDAPQSFDGYRPGNFQAGFIGPVSVSEALVRSLNVPAVDVLDRVGPTRFAASLRAGGLRLYLPHDGQPNLSLILGGAGATLYDLVGAYRALARDGMAGTPRLAADEPIVERRMMSAQAAFIVRDILENGGHPDRPFSARRQGLAWKTGTSFGFRDAWAIGVTDRHTLGVWVGRPDGTPNPGYFGANIAEPLLADIVAALPGQDGFARRAPEGVSRARICWPLGLAAEATPTGQCHQERSAWVLQGATPPTLPDRLRPSGLVQTIWIDPATGLRTTPACTPDASMHAAAAAWPVATLPWLERRGIPVPALPAWLPQCAPAGGAHLRIQGIAHGSILRPAAGRKRVELKVSARAEGQHLYWLLDGQPRQAETNGMMALQFDHSGIHTLTAMDDAGNFDSIRFEIAGVSDTR